MTDVTNTNTGELTVIEDLAREAQHWARGTAFNMLQLGRVLTEAKVLVKHGDWEEWIRENAGLDKRAAQYFMACYARFGTDTPLAELGPSKMIALLGATDEMLEKLTEEKDLGKMSVRAIKEEVRKAREEEQQKAREAVEAERNSGLLALARERELSEKKMEELSLETEKRVAEIQRSILEGFEAEQKAREAAESRVRELEARGPELPEEVAEDIRQKTARIAELESQMASVKAEAEDAFKSVMEGTEDMRKQSAAAIVDKDRLRREVDAKNRMLESLQADYEKVREELAALQMTVAKGDAERTSGDILSLDAIHTSVCAFLDQNSRLPYLHSTFAAMDEKEYECIRADMMRVQDFLTKVLHAIDTVNGTGGVIA